MKTLLFIVKAPFLLLLMFGVFLSLFAARILDKLNGDKITTIGYLRSLVGFNTSQIDFVEQTKAPTTKVKVFQ